MFNIATEAEKLASETETEVHKVWEEFVAFFKSKTPAATEPVKEPSTPEPVASTEPAVATVEAPAAPVEEPTSPV